MGRQDMKRNRGFTLIELMTVVIVIAVLAAIAIPSYLNQTRKSRRNKAEDAMQQIALLEERYRADNSGFVDAPATTSSSWAKYLGGYPGSSYYDYKVLAVPASTTSSGTTAATYTITATGKSSQLKDTDRSSGSNCKTLTYGVDTNGQTTRTPSGCWQQ
jgi:type IV pilus assembly protein PilE